MLTTNPNHFKLGSRLALRRAHRPSSFLMRQTTAKLIADDDMEIQHWLSGGYSVMKEMSDA